MFALMVLLSTSAALAQEVKIECKIIKTTYEEGVVINNQALKVDSIIKMTLDFLDAKLELLSSTKKKLDLSNAVVDNNPSAIDPINYQVYIHFGLETASVDDNKLFEINIKKFTSNKLENIQKTYGNSYRVYGEILYSDSNHSQLKVADLVCN